MLGDAVMATRQVSRAGKVDALVALENGRTETALGIQEKFHAAAVEALAGRDDETDWILEQWAWVLDALRRQDVESLLGAVDWISKRWLLETFRSEHGLTWNDPWLESLDLEYHNLNPSRGLFFALPTTHELGEFNLRSRRESALREPPHDTRAKGRSLAVERFMETRMPFVVNWDSVTANQQQALPMGDPLSTYETEVRALIERA
jgi:hypothetical protein